MIHHDLTVAEASDWQWWLAVSPYDYKDGLVYVDKRATGGEYYQSKMLWAVGNFSRFVRPGMTRVAVSRSDSASPDAVVEDLMVSAYWKQDDGTVVVVCVNRATQERTVRLDFEGVDVGSLIPYVTKGDSTGTDNLTAYAALGSTDRIAIPARSVVTLVGTAGNFGDWDQNAKVDLRDFAVLAAGWSGTRDNTSSGKPGAGFRDVGVLADYWLADFRLAAHWKLDEASGGIAHDSAAHRDATIKGGPVWQPAGGRIHGALQFDGIDDCVSTPLALDPAVRNFTVFAWIKGGAPGQVILSQAGGANWLMAAPDGTLRTELKQSGRQGKALGCATVIADEAWHRVGLTWDGSNRILYVDGTEVARDTQGTLLSCAGSVSIGVGSDREGTGFWKGLIDDVRVHNRPVQP